MNLSPASIRWLLVVFVFLAIIAGSGTYLIFANGYDSPSVNQSRWVINQVRLHVSEIMAYLERDATRTLLSGRKLR